MMRDTYVYRKKIYRRYFKLFKYRAVFALVIIIALLIAAFSIKIDLHHNPTKPQTSKVQNTVISDATTVIRSPYFQFKDAGKWVLDTRSSSDNKYIYTKFKGLRPIDQLFIYVNYVPEPLYLATSRVLPVRIVNSNSFDVTSISTPCVGYYTPADKQIVKTVSINQATMLCSPDTPRYTVQLAEIGGDYQLHLQRKDGSKISFVINFLDEDIIPNPQTIINVTSSFESI